MNTLTTYQLCSITTIRELSEVVEEIVQVHGEDCDLDFYDGELVVMEAEDPQTKEMRKQLEALQHELFVTKQQLHRANQQLEQRGTQVLELKHQLVNTRVRDL